MRYIGDKLRKEIERIIEEGEEPPRFPGKHRHVQVGGPDGQVYGINCPPEYDVEPWPDICGLGEDP